MPTNVHEVDDFGGFSKLFDSGGPFDKRAGEYIFRGQEKHEWKLTPTLERLFQKARQGTKREEFENQHLSNFRKAIRGRRGENPAKLEELDLWALGQHYGLATPLLDWTSSPFIALYFAFSKSTSTASENSNDASAPDKKRSVWCLNQRHIEKFQDQLLRARAKELDDGKNFAAGFLDYKNEVSYNRLNFVVPNLDENNRLLVQSGLFTYCRLPTTVDEWVDGWFCNYPDVLYRIDIPDIASLRRKILRSLGLMNVHSASLFPDLVGARLRTHNQ